MEDRQHTTKECADKLILETILQDKFFYFKAEEGGVAVATATDDNAADEKSDKSIWRLLNIRCTRSGKTIHIHGITRITSF